MFTLLTTLLAACGNNEEPRNITEDVPPDTAGLCIQSDPEDTDRDEKTDSIEVQGPCSLHDVVSSLEDSDKYVFVKSGYDNASGVNYPTFGGAVKVGSNETLTIEADLSSGHPVLIEMSQTDSDDTAAFSVATGGQLNIFGNGVLSIQGSGHSTGIETSSGEVSVSETTFNLLAYGIAASDGAVLDISNAIFKNSTKISLALFEDVDLTMTDSVIKGGFTDIGEVLQEYGLYTEDAGTLKLYRNGIGGTRTNLGTIRLDGNYVDVEGLVVAKNESYGQIMSVYGSGSDWEDSTARHHVVTSVLTAENNTALGVLAIAGPYDIELTNVTLTKNYGLGSSSPLHVVDLTYLDEEELADENAAGMDYDEYGTTSFLQSVVANNWAVDTIVARSEDTNGDTVSYSFFYDNGPSEKQIENLTMDYTNMFDIEPDYYGAEMFVVEADGSTTVYPFTYHILNEEASSFEAGYNDWYDTEAGAAAGYGIFGGPAGNYGLAAAYALCVGVMSEATFCDSEREAFLTALGGSAAESYDEYYDE